MTLRRKRPRTTRQWQWVFDSRNRPLGVIEEDGGRWRVYIADRHVGTCGSREAALAAIAKIGANRQGADGK